MKPRDLEGEFLLQLRAAGLPEPERQWVFAPPLRWAFDFAWLRVYNEILGALPGNRLAVEVDGGTWSGGRHTTGKGFEDDCRKLDLAVCLGWKVLRVTADMIENGEALLLVEIVFGRRLYREYVERRTAAIKERRQAGARKAAFTRALKKQEAARR